MTFRSTLDFVRARARAALGLEADAPQVKLGVKRWQLEKFEGEHVEGDGKQPCEIIAGGDGRPTVRIDCRTGTTTILKAADPMEVL